MENNKRTHRSPSEIIAETEARLEKLRLKQAKQDAQSNPAVAALMEERDAVQKDLREAKKILGSGPQSASARLAKHEAWIEKINEAAEEALQAESVATQKVAEIDLRIQAEIQSLTASE